MNIPGLIALSAIVLLAAAGCTRSDADGLPRAPVEPAATYHPTRGLKLSPLSSQFVGLAVSDFTGRLPADSILRTVQGTFVYVENGGWLLRTRVVLGAASEDRSNFALVEGLYEGDRIVTAGVRALWLAELHFLRAGQACAHEG